MNTPATQRPQVVRLSLGNIVLLSAAFILVNAVSFWLMNIYQDYERAKMVEKYKDMVPVHSNVSVTPLPQGYPVPSSPVVYESYVDHYSTVVNAADLKIGEDETLIHVPSEKDKAGVTFYPWVNLAGKHLDVYVQTLPGGLHPQLVAYPADRVGGSKGPAEPPVARAEESEPK